MHCLGHGSSCCQLFTSLSPSSPSFYYYSLQLIFDISTKFFFIILQTQLHWCTLYSSNQLREVPQFMQFFSLISYTLSIYFFLFCKNSPKRYTIVSSLLQQSLKLKFHFTFWFSSFHFTFIICNSLFTIHLRI